MKKRSLFIALLTAGMVLAGAMTALAAEAGWSQDTSGRWRYTDKNGNFVTSQWQKGADNLWRWLDSSGYMASSAWVDDTYYIGSDGVMVAGKWLQITDRDGTYWYYFNETGKRVQDKWMTIAGKKYHFDEDGRMETGWILDDTYYCDENGVMKTGWALLRDPSDSEEGPTTAATTTSDDTHWYYFLTSGKKFTPEISGMENYAERRIDGTRYCFDSDGKLQTGWVNLGDSDTTGISNYRFCNTDGTVRTGWYSYYPPDDIEGSYDRAVVWFYFNTDGRPKCDTDGRLSANEIIKIGGKQYLFNENGNPVYGLQKVYDSATSETWHTYYFGSYTNCTLQSGKFTLEESGGDRVAYYFATGGRGYDGVKDGYLYYNGRVQKAESGTGYQVISIPTSVDGQYKNYLVNTSGKVEKNKSATKDKDGVKYATNGNGIVTAIDGMIVGDEMLGNLPTEPDFTSD